MNAHCLRSLAVQTLSPFSQIASRASSSLREVPDNRRPLGERAENVKLNRRSFVHSARLIETLLVGVAVFGTLKSEAAPPRLPTSSSSEGALDKATHPQTAKREILVSLKMPWVRSSYQLGSGEASRLMTAREVKAQQEMILEYLARALQNDPKSYEVRHLYRWAPTLLLNVDQTAYKLLSDHPEVVGVHPNRLNMLNTASSIPYTGADTLHAVLNGAGRAIAVIDSPVDPSHSDFGVCDDLASAECRVKQIVNFVDDPLDSVNPTHGTNVAAITLAVAPNADVYSLNPFHNTELGIRAFDSDILEAIDWVIEQKTQQGIPFISVNLSLGGGAFDPPCYQSAFTGFFSQLYAIRVLPIVATGNDANPTMISSPACAPGSVAVGALLDRAYSFNASNCSQQGVAGDVVCFTNQNGLIDLMAPGLSITAGGYTLSGTSMATPHVAGAVALLDHAFDGQLSALNLINILKFWSVPTPQADGRTYSSLNFKADVLSQFEYAATTSFMFNQTTERQISALGALESFEVPAEQSFKVGKAYVLVKVDHPDPTQLEVYLTSPDGQRAGGVLGAGAIADGSNLNAVLGHDLAPQHFRELTGVDTIGTWQLEVIDPQSQGGYLLSAALFLAQVDEVNDSSVTCDSCVLMSDCEEGFSCHLWDEPGQRGVCVSACGVDDECEVGFSCLNGLCLPDTYRQCKGDEVWLYSGCGHEISRETTCAQTCLHGECVGGCVEDASRGCDGGAVYAYDSCGARGALITQCQAGEVCQEIAGEAECLCASNSYIACQGDELHQFNSCGVSEGVVSVCAPDERCEINQCISVGCVPDELEENDTRQTATELALNQKRSALNFCLDGQDYYRVNLTTGQSYDFETYVSGLTDTTMELYSPAGSRLRSDANGGDGQASLIANFTPSSSGAYVLSVSSVNGSIGAGRDYELLARPACVQDNFEHNDRFETSRALQASPLPLELTLCDVDWFKVTVNAGDEYLFATGLAGAGDTTLELLDAQRQRIAFNDDSEGLASRIDYTFTEGGTYYLVVRSFAEIYQSGSYTLRVQTSGAELCDGLDNDLDGQVDEALALPLADKRSGICADSRKICAGINGWVEPDYQLIEGYEASEQSCDGVDNDCDGQVDDQLSPPLASDQEGVCSGARQSCAGVRGWIEPDYTLISGYESAEVLCDGRDNDCDGQVDESLPPTLASNQRGVCEGALQICDGARGWRSPDYSLQPGFEYLEVSCDGRDNDCDGRTDESLFPPSADLQSGVCAGSFKACGGSRGWIEPSYLSLAGYELNELTCDGVDNDCDGDVDEALIAPSAQRQDGVCAGARQSCLGVDGWVEPNYQALPNYEMNESTCDGEDNDCDGQVDESLTPPPSNLSDGVCAGLTQRCEGPLGWVEPEYSTIPDYEVGEVSCDGVDNDCDRRIDESLDAPLSTAQSGVCLGGRQVCENASGWVEPDLSLTPDYEIDEVSCDGLDNDCDDLIDESLSAPLALRQSGVCAGLRQRCTGLSGWGEPEYSAREGYESLESACDGLDNDCDGLTDEGLIGSLTAEQRGVCAGARQACVGVGGWVDPHPSTINRYEESEVSCDGVDNDCDGLIDESLSAPLAERQEGVCAEARQVCHGEAGWGQPSYQESLETYEEDEVSCDGLDNDCDGATDEGLDGLSAPLSTLQLGVCAGARDLCGGEMGWSSPDYTLLNGYEEVELSCDGRDNDCDGAVDEALDAPLIEEQRGVCEGVRQVCEGVRGWVTPESFEGYEFSETSCDELDNDCDGIVDEPARCDEPLGGALIEGGEVAGEVPLPESGEEAGASPAGEGAPITSGESAGEVMVGGASPAGEGVMMVGGEAPSAGMNSATPPEGSGGGRSPEYGCATQRGSAPVQAWLWVLLSGLLITRRRIYS